MNVEVLRIENLYKSYKTDDQIVRALDGLNLSIMQGELIVIMGSSGSGKSTLLNLIGALDEPTKGDFYLMGEKIHNYHKEPMATKFRRDSIGFVFQEYNLLKTLTVYENILVGLFNGDIAGHEIEEMMSLFSILEYRDTVVSNLSGGQQQRVAIVRALANRPKIVLADEPTGNLDSNMTINVMETINKARTKYKQTIVVVTHDPLVATYGDRVIFIENGRIEASYHNDPRKSREERILEILTTTKDMLLKKSVVK